VGRLHGLGGAGLRSRVDEVLEIVGLTAAAHRRIGGYSGGMRQRLGIGQAIINQPRVLFLDEPVSSLDPEGRRDVLDIISRLRGTATVFMSTHILNDVERVCDRIAILKLRPSGRGGPDRRAPRPLCPADLRAPAGTAPARRGGPARGGDARPTMGERRPDHSGLGSRLRRRPQIAGPAILPLVVASGVNLARYERARPNLEDVFLRLVAEGGPATAPPVTVPAWGLDGRGRR